MPLKPTRFRLDSFDIRDVEHNTADFGVLYNAYGEATEEIFITAKTTDGKEITIIATIEEADEFIHAIEVCRNIAILARHGKFTKPAQETRDEIEKTIIDKIKITGAVIRGKVN